MRQFTALRPDERHRYELDEGALSVSPPPAPLHMRVLGRLFARVEAQVPADLAVFLEIGVELPGSTVRVPDLSVTAAGIDLGSPLVNAADVRLVVEVVSPGSRRIDRLRKPAQYARAGIRHFWLVEPEPPVTVTAYTLVAGGYKESLHVVGGTLEVADPCPLRLDLDCLAP
ncbi:Uma2 family endonuclease [Actinokineospora auranticolor]|uniref:Uma2 family endonuclease n=1 Tax=Actinokineospora auranticolor TaxID=155976 RepID=A0A2S6GE01_9PSEU|nr:Uma2 family endonuclease [Actinokineospora auranticolor]